MPKLPDPSPKANATDPASRTLLHTVAKLHYEQDLSQVEIARRLAVSTATISRLLRRARDEGVVRIEIRDVTTPEDLNARLVGRLGLKQAGVVDVPEAGALAALAQPLGQLLAGSGLTHGSVLAIGWGRAVREVILAGLPRLPGVITVPATGGMQQVAPHFQVNEFVRMAAQSLGGIPRFIHAPYLPAAETRQAFLNEPAIRDNVELWNRVDVAIVGVGIPHAIDPTHSSAHTPSEQVLLHAAGDVIRHYYDGDGRIIPWQGEERLIAMSPDRLRATPLVIGVAISPAKAGAILGAVRAGFINALVTDVRTAEAVLEAHAAA